MTDSTCLQQIERPNERPTDRLNNRDMQIFTMTAGKDFCTHTLTHTYTYAKRLKLYHLVAFVHTAVSLWICWKIRHKNVNWIALQCNAHYSPWFLIILVCIIYMFDSVAGIKVVNSKIICFLVRRTVLFLLFHWICEKNPLINGLSLRFNTSSNSDIISFCLL